MNAIKKEDAPLNPQQPRGHEASLMHVPSKEGTTSQLQTPPAGSVNLDEAMKREYSASKLAWLIMLVLQGVSLAIAFLGVLWGPSVHLATITFFVGAFVPTLSVVLKKYAGDRYSKGEEIRRLRASNDGWGMPLESHDHLLLAADATTIPSWDPAPIGTYYNSKKAPGSPRAAHNAQQSAFFTRYLARTAEKLCFAVVAVSVVIAIILVIFVLNGVGAVETTKQMTQVAGSLLSFSVSSEFLQLALGYRELSATCQDTVKECGKLAKEKRPSAPSVYRALGDYDCALAKAPPIPGIIYKIRRKRLQNQWDILENSEDASMR